MMGFEGLKEATQVAILNANYLANRLKILYTLSRAWWIPHEFIIDIRPIKEISGISEEDIASD